MIRLLDLPGLFRERRLEVFRDGPFALPGFVSPADQEALLALLQQRGAPSPLERVELDVAYGLLRPARELLSRILQWGRAAEVMVVLRGAGDPGLRATLFEDDLLAGFRHVVVVVPHPGGEEPLGAFGELCLAVRDAARDAYAAKSDALGLDVAVLDGWQDVIVSLQNPCDVVGLVNDLVHLQLEGDAGERLERAVARRVVARQLAWRPADEVVALLALAADREALAEGALGAEGFSRAREGLRAANLWHPDDGLLDWCSLMRDRASWERSVGAAGAIPTAVQRAVGWGALHDEFCAQVTREWWEAPDDDATDFARDAHRALVLMDDGDRSVAEELATKLSRRVDYEATESSGRWRYLALRGALAAAQDRFDDARIYMQGAVDEAEKAGAQPQTVGNLRVEVGDLLRKSECFAESVAVLDTAIAALVACPPVRRRLGRAYWSKALALGALGRTEESLDAARRSLAERVAVGASLREQCESYVAVAWALALAQQYLPALGVDREAAAVCERLGNPPALRVKVLWGTMVIHEQMRHRHEVFHACTLWLFTSERAGSLREFQMVSLWRFIERVRVWDPELADALEARARDFEEAAAKRPPGAT